MCLSGVFDAESLAGSFYVFAFDVRHLVCEIMCAYAMYALFISEGKIEVVLPEVLVACLCQQVSRKSGCPGSLKLGLHARHATDNAVWQKLSRVQPT